MRSAILVAIEAAAASVTARMTVNSNKQYIVTGTAEAIVTVIVNISNRNRPTCKSDSKFPKQDKH